MKIICISGKAQHGKDTTALYLKEELSRSGLNVLIIHYGDLLKHLCKNYFGWNGEKNEEGRELLQHIGTGFVRKQSPDYWVDFVEDFLQLFPYQWDVVLIPDCRFPNEVREIQDTRFKKLHLRIIRTGFDSPLTPQQQQHISETALDDVSADFYLHNNGTLDELKESVAEFAWEVMK